MKKILIPLADGFEEIETVTLIDVLRRAGLDVIAAGLSAKELKGAHGVRLVPDRALDAVKDQSFDMVILPGGQPGVDNLRKDGRVLEVLKRMKSEGKLIGAICAAPMVLRDAGLISGVKLTSYPSVESELSGSCYETESVVVDGKIITSRGPGTALEFSLKIVELLLEKKKSDELSQALLIS